MGVHSAVTRPGYKKVHYARTGIFFVCTSVFFASAGVLMFSIFDAGLNRAVMALVAGLFTGGFIFLLLAAWTFLSLLKTFGFLMSERRDFLSLIDTFGGVIEYDADNVVRFVNTQAEVLFEVDAAAVVGQQMTEKFFEDSPMRNLAVAVLKFRGEESRQMALQSSTGIVYQLRVLNIPLRNEEGDRVGTIKIFQDITRETFVSQMKTEFITVAAHQLRTPLTTIRWALAGLLKEDAAFTPTQRIPMEKAYNSAARMAQLIGDLLDVTSIEEGRFGFSFTMGSIVTLITNTVAKFSVTAEERGVTLSFNRPEYDTEPFKFDQEKIERALSNIIDNALRYTPRGGSITVSLVVEKPFVKVTIHDTGIGIPRAEQGRLFTKFFRATNALKIEPNGTGLGLFITRNIIHRHGGTLGVHSTSSGTSVNFTLPVEESLIPTGVQTVISE